ncbi:MAG TPA: hypothetical protein VE035_17250 [Puia sp.]|nr:hypothetical protein [Puia sp.]
MITTKPPKSTQHAVLTADIVNSTKLDKAVEKALVKEFEKILKPYQYEFYRGDSFQVYVKEPEKSLWVALVCRTAAISMTAGEGEMPVSDLKVSIGIGSVSKPVRSLGTAKGTAFLLSGRSLDYMQGTARRLGVTTGNELADIGLLAITDYIDAIYRKMTAKQAATIYGLLKGATQQQLAQDLEKSKSTISELAGAGGWPEIEKLLLYFENLIKELP